MSAKNDPGHMGSGWARSAFGGGASSGIPRPDAAEKAAARVVLGPGRRVVYVPDHEDFGEFMLSDQMRDVTTEVAQDIQHTARRLAPRRKDRGQVPDGAAMADRFRVNENAGVIQVSGNLRVKVEVYNEAPSAAPNEFGGKRNRRTRMLGRAGAAHGDFHGDL